MTTQPQLLQIPLDTGDVVYTPDWVARDMVDFFKPTGRILEPCKGDGVFMKYLPDDTEWCEIQDGRDFFAWHEPVDWIIGNPPYSATSEWIYKSMEIAKDFVYLVPTQKPFYSMKMAKFMESRGKIKHMRYYGTGSELGFPTGFACGAVHFQKDYRGPMYTTIADRITP